MIIVINDAIRYFNIGLFEIVRIQGSEIEKLYS